MFPTKGYSIACEAPSTDSLLRGTINENLVSPQNWTLAYVSIVEHARKRIVKVPMTSPMTRGGKDGPREDIFWSRSRRQNKGKFKLCAVYGAAPPQKKLFTGGHESPYPYPSDEKKGVHAAQDELRALQLANGSDLYFWIWPCRVTPLPSK